MGTLVASMATSHAFAFMEPSKWAEFLTWNRRVYQQRYGVEPPIPAEFKAESPERNAERYARLRAAHDRMQRDLQTLRPDVLLVIGDDQNEHFREENIPQIAIYN